MSQFNVDFNQSGNSIFENVYIYGTLQSIGGDGTGQAAIGNFLQTNEDGSLNDLTLNHLNIKNDLTVTGTSIFNGPVTINDTLTFTEDIAYENLELTDSLKVGVGGTLFYANTNHVQGIGIGINSPRQLLDIDGTTIVSGSLGVGTISPREKLDIVGNSILEGDVAIPSGDVGIGTANPVQKLQINTETNKTVVVTSDGVIGAGVTNPATTTYISGLDNTTHGKLRLAIDGSVSIKENIYDSVGGAGTNGYYLARDLNGIRWQSASPSSLDGFYIQDEGSTLPVDGTAQLFGYLNFTEINSLGTGTDTLVTIPDPTNPTSIAKVQVKDLWGYNSDNIYRMSKVGIENSNPEKTLDVTGTFRATQAANFGSSLTVTGTTTLKSTLTVTNGTTLNSTLGVSEATTLNNTLDVTGKVTFSNATDASSTTNASLVVTGGVGIGKSLQIGGDLSLSDNKKAEFGNSADLQIFHDAGLGINDGRIVDTTGHLKLETSTDKNIYLKTGSSQQTNLIALATQGVQLNFNGTERLSTSGVGVTVTGITSTTDLYVTGVSTFVGVSTFKDDVGIAKTLTLQSFVRDVNNDTGVGIAKTDYRLASVGTGVSWRPSGVETENAIWVSVDGIDTNSGLLEGDAKRTIGAAAAIAQAGDTIIVRSGVYKENNPVGLRTDVSISGEDLRLVTVVPLNPDKDVFQVRRGCLIQNLNFAGLTKGVDHTNCGAVAFPPTAVGISGGVDFQAVTGYTELGPANEGPNGRYRSPYVRNCTNFMTGSVGMKLNGDYVNAEFTGVNDIGQDLKSMVCDSFTQYNEAGIGVSITNSAYAQLVSIFTIGCEKAIYCDTGGQCDLTNSNSSFGTYGLYADGYGDIEFEGVTKTATSPEVDVVSVDSVTDNEGNFRKPFDGQGLYFHINLNDYSDVSVAGQITQPLQLIRSINVTFGGNPGDYSSGAPPIVTVNNPLGPEAIFPEFSPNVSDEGIITSIDVINSGRNFLPNQVVNVTISGDGSATAVVDMDPILFTVERATEPDKNGLTNVTLNEFLPYSIGPGVKVDFVRLSRIITSSHSFEYVGAGTDINRANPFQGGEPVPENEIIAINGGQVPFTSTDQKGNFRIGEGLTIDQTTSTISGRDFNRAIQAQLTPLILALR